MNGIEHHEGIYRPTFRETIRKTDIVECPTYEGCHYDYDRQAWVDGHDHYHTVSGTIARLYCGQALAGCRRGLRAWGDTDNE